MRARLGLVVMVLAACAAPTPATGGATLRFTLPAPGAPLDFGDVPFPSDLYLDASGTLAVGALPTTRSDSTFFTSLRAMLAARDGFCSTCSLHAYVDGALDPASVPTSAPASTGDASASDAIVLLDLDTDAPHLTPLRVWYDPAHDHLAFRPVRGRTLGGSRRWALAITSRLRAMDGTPLRASDDFLAIRDGRDTTHATTRAAIDALVMAGVPRDTIVGATTFTTGSTGMELVAMRASLHATPVPTATIDRIYDHDTLDELFGVPAEDRPGVDVASLPGADGPHAMIHEAIGTVVLGHLSAPRVLTGSGTDVGTLLTDASGMPMAGPSEDVPFVLVVPASAPPASGYPVLFVHHGFNASRVTALTMSDTAARAGYATFGIDAYQHGARASSAMDLVHDLRGSAGPDGLAETDMAHVSARTFGIEGTPSGMEVYPAYPLGAFMQFAADVMSSVRYLRDGDLAPFTSAGDPALATLALDREHVAYLGISMGSVIGTSVVAAEPDVHAAVLVVPPGSIVETLCEGVAFRNLTAVTLAGLLHIEGRFDEITHACVGDPIVDLVRWGLEPIDPLVLAPHFYDQPLVAGPRPDAVWITSSNDEVASPPAAESVFSRAFLPGVGTFMSAPVTPITLPAMANMTGAPGSPTALVVRIEPASHGLCEVQGADANYALPIEPPYVHLPMPMHYDNPIAETHMRIGGFLSSALGGHARMD